MKKVSGLIITYNEQKNVADCIKSLREVCDDIVVVDSCSSDQTVSIAEDMGARVIRQPFLGDGPQRSVGVSICQNDWILNLDADERLTPGLVEGIKKLDLENNSVDVFEFKRLNYIGSRTTKYAGQYPDYVARLFNRLTADFTPVKAHTRVRGKKHQKLNCQLVHFSYRDYSDLFNRQCKYAAWMAEEYVEQGKLVSPVAPFCHCVWTFVRHYFIKLGFLAGLDGLSISIAKATGTYLKYAYSLELQRNRKK